MKNSLCIASCGSSQFGQSTQTNDISIPVECSISGIEQIKAGGWHNACICIKGISFWGCNNDQQIPKASSNLLRSPSSYQVAYDLHNIALGSKHTVLHLKNNSILSFGSNSNLQLPPNVVSDVINVYAKFEASAVVTSSNLVIYGIGSGQISIPIDGIPKNVELTTKGCAILTEQNRLLIYEGDCKVSEFDGVISVAASRKKVIFLSADSRVFEIEGTDRIQVGGIPEIPIKVFAGSAHYGCVTFEGSCYMWGCGTRGQLGNGLFSYQFIPQRVIIDPKKRVIDACAGEDHSLFLLTKEEVFMPKKKSYVNNPLIESHKNMKNIELSTFVPPETDIRF